MILSFHTERRELERRMPVLRERMEQNGRLWIAWPKKASKLPTDITENVVREIALANALVDNKVAAIDEIWSGSATGDPGQGPTTLTCMDLPEDQRLKDISPKAYEHPADRAATAALQQIPMMDTVVRKLIEFGERSVLQQLLASAVRLGEDQLPEV